MGFLLPSFIGMLTLGSLSIAPVTRANTTPALTKIQLAQKLNCKNDPSLNQAQINQCAKLSYQNADKKLNQVYQKLLPTLDKSRKQKLIIAQQAWVKFRDTNCEFERSANEGGSIAPTVYFGCLERTTQQRTKQLQEYLQPER